MRGLLGCSITVLVLSFLSGCVQLPDIPLWGRVDLDAPVGGTTITVAKASTGETVWEGAVNDGFYLARLDTIETPICGVALTLSASGGTVNGARFDGTLMTHIPAYLPGEHMETNIVTTLVARCMEQRGFSHGDARKAVFEYLQLPHDYAFVDRAHHGESESLFDPERFLDESAEYGGFDAYVDHLVKNEIGLGATRGFGSLEAGAAGDPAKQVVAAAMEVSVGHAMMEGVLSGVAAFATEQALGWILSSFGYEDEGAQNFKEVQESLDRMNGKLDTLIDQSYAIEEELNAVLAAVQLGDDEIIQEINGSLIAGPQSIIENQFNNLHAAYPPTSSTAHTDTGHASAQSTAHDLLDAGKYDIDQQLYYLHSGIMGYAVGTTGFLDACTNVLIDKVAGGQDLYSCYLVLENYYCKLFAIQGKGLVLMSEALHFVNGDLTPATKSFSGSVQDYYNKYNANMETQLGKFMTCVDRLVASRMDVRTDLAAPVQLLPDGAASVYARCDFLAHQVSAAQPAGLIARIIGTPSAVAAALNSGVTAVDETIAVTNYQCPTCSPDKTGGTTADKTTTTTTYPFSVVNVNGVATNLSTPSFPSHSSDATIKPDTRYLEWTGSASTGFKYNLQTKVAVVKLVMGAGHTTSYTETCYDCGEGVTSYWVVNPGLRGSTSGSIMGNVKQYDDQFNVASGGTSFGCLVFPARVNPGAWSTSTSWAKKQGSSTLSPSFDPASMRFAEMLTVNEYDTKRVCGSGGGGYPVCVDYWVFSYDATGAFAMDITPLTSADAAVLSANAKLKVGLANGIKDVLNSEVDWKATLGSSVSTPTVTSAGTYSSSPQNVTPTTAINMNTRNDDTSSTYVPSVKFQFSGTTAASLKLQHEITGYSEFTQETRSLPCDASAVYTKLELFPVP